LLASGARRFQEGADIDPPEKGGCDIRSPSSVVAVAQGMFSDCSVVTTFNPDHMAGIRRPGFDAFCGVFGTSIV
jgi:hypothetical protein